MDVECHYLSFIWGKVYRNHIVNFVNCKFNVPARLGNPVNSEINS